MSHSSARINAIGATLPAGPSNEDRYCIQANFAIVLDGASAFRAVHPSVSQYVDALLKHLRIQLLSSQYDHDTARLVRTAINSTVSELRLTRETTPASTVNICRRIGGSWYMYLLGDSPSVVVMSDHEVKTFVDERLVLATGRHLEGYQNRLSIGTGFDAQHFDMLRRMQEHQYLVRNSDAGYWIAADDPDAADRGIQIELPTDGVLAIFMCSDGAFESVARIDDFGWVQAVNSTESTLMGLLERAHTLEIMDPEGMLYPRAKIHDDKTILLVRDS